MQRVFQFGYNFCHTSIDKVKSPTPIYRRSPLPCPMQLETVLCTVPCSSILVVQGFIAFVSLNKRFMIMLQRETDLLQKR